MTSLRQRRDTQAGTSLQRTRWLPGRSGHLPDAVAFAMNVCALMGSLILIRCGWSGWDCVVRFTCATGAARARRRDWRYL